MDYFMNASSRVVTQITVDVLVVLAETMVSVRPHAPVVAVVRLFFIRADHVGGLELLSPLQTTLCDVKSFGCDVKSFGSDGIADLVYHLLMYAGSFGGMQDSIEALIGEGEVTAGTKSFG